MRINLGILPKGEAWSAPLAAEAWLAPEVGPVGLAHRHLLRVNGKCRRPGRGRRAELWGLALGGYQCQGFWLSVLSIIGGKQMGLRTDQHAEAGSLALTS